MPVYRGPDGKIIEENTRTTSSSQQAKRGSVNVEGKTRRMSSSRPVPPPSSSDAVANPKASDSDISGETKLYKGSSPEAAPQEPELQASEQQDPVVGWLVVVEGPGKGSDFSLGLGNNDIARGEGAKVSLNFGDKQISREGHATLTYEPKTCQFFIQGGGGRNLTYVDDEVVLTPTSLAGGSIIQVGETHLKFVAFCGDDFNWQN